MSMEYEQTMNEFDYFRGYLKQPSSQTQLQNVKQSYDQMMSEFNYSLRPKLPSLKKEQYEEDIANIESVYGKHMEMYDYTTPEILDDKSKCARAVRDLQLNLYRVTEQNKFLIKINSELVLENQKIREGTAYAEAQKEITDMRKTIQRLTKAREFLTFVWYLILNKSNILDDTKYSNDMDLLDALEEYDKNEIEFRDEMSSGIIV